MIKFHPTKIEDHPLYFPLSTIFAISKFIRSNRGWLELIYTLKWSYGGWVGDVLKEVGRLSHSRFLAIDSGTLDLIIQGLKCWQRWKQQQRACDRVSAQYKTYRPKFCLASTHVPYLGYADPTASWWLIWVLSYLVDAHVNWNYCWAISDSHAYIKWFSRCLIKLLQLITYEDKVVKFLLGIYYIICCSTNSN